MPTSGKKKDYRALSRLAGWCSNVGAIIAFGAATALINQGFHFLVTGSFLGWGSAARREEQKVAWFDYALTFWHMPGSLLLTLAALSLLLALASAALASRNPTIRVYGLVGERLFALTYGSLIGLLGLQLGIFMLAICYAQVVLNIDPLATSLLRAAIASIGYLLIALCCLALALRVAYDLLIRGSAVTWLILVSFSRGRRSEPFLPVPVQQTGGILVVSDLHLTRDGVVTLEHGRETQAALDFLRDAVRMQKPKLVLCCGDATDTGDPAAWSRLHSTVADLGVPFLCIPGNHDYHFRKMLRPKETTRAYLKNLFSLGILADRSYSPAEVLGHVNIAATEPILRFPTLASRDEWGVDILMLDSNQRSSNSPITNAIGLVGKSQLTAAAHLLTSRRSKERPLLVLVHHHIDAPPSIGRAARLFLCCLDAEKLLRLAESHRPAIMLHGHLHMPYMRSGTVDVVSCGSALFGPRGPCRTQLRDAASAFVINVDAGGFRTFLYQLPGDREPS